jgi:hypothetical protein
LLPDPSACGARESNPIAIPYTKEAPNAFANMFPSKHAPCSSGVAIFPRKMTEKNCISDTNNEPTSHDAIHKAQEALFTHQQHTARLVPRQTPNSLADQAQATASESEMDYVALASC